MIKKYETIIIEIINHCLSANGLEKIENKYYKLTELGINSIVFAQIIVLIEKLCDIQIPDDSLIYEADTKVSDLIDICNELLEGKT